MSVTKYLVSGALLAALALMLPPIAAAQPDFTLGPGGKITVSVDEDSTTAGCVDAATTDTSECDSYSMEIPLTVYTSGDLADDLAASADVSLRIGNTGELCAHDATTFTTDFPGSSFKLTKTKTSESAKFVGHTLAVSDNHHRVTVPISITLKASRQTGMGTLNAKGLAQGLGALSGATVDVLLAVQEDGDGNNNSCVTLPVTFKKTP